MFAAFNFNSFIITEKMKPKVNVSLVQNMSSLVYCVSCSVCIVSDKWLQSQGIALETTIESNIL